MGATRGRNCQNPHVARARPACLPSLPVPGSLAATRPRKHRSRSSQSTPLKPRQQVPAGGALTWAGLAPITQPGAWRACFRRSALAGQHQIAPVPLPQMVIRPGGDRGAHATWQQTGQGEGRPMVSVLRRAAQGRRGQPRAPPCSTTRAARSPCDAPGRPRASPRAGPGGHCCLGRPAQPSRAVRPREGPAGRGRARCLCSARRRPPGAAPTSPTHGLPG